MSHSLHKPVLDSTPIDSNTPALVGLSDQKAASLFVSLLEEFKEELLKMPRGGLEVDVKLIALWTLTIDRLMVRVRASL